MGLSRVALISNTCQSRWLAGQLKDKDLFVCPEMTSGCTWPKSLFLSLQGEGAMAYEKKYEAPGVMVNTAQGIFMSNEGIPWTGGEVVRRLIPFRFGNPILVEDLTLRKRLSAEMPMLLAKGVICYQTMLGQVNASPLPLTDHLRAIGGSQFSEAQQLMLPPGSSV